MNFSRRTKGKGGGYSPIKTTRKLDINLDLSSLNLMCNYILSENRNIRRSHIINMRNLILMLDRELYVNDEERVKRLDFIQKGIEARLNYNLQDPIMILKHINGGIMEEDTEKVKNFTSMNNDEIAWVNETVSESLKYAYLYSDIDILGDAILRFKSCEYRYRGEIVDEIVTIITRIQNNIRRAKVETLTEMTFSLRAGAFEDCIREVHEALSSPANKLLTGMQGFNELLAGGFESGRTYMIFGLPGEGKSTTLLNLAYQIKTNNRFYKCKDTTKTPCVVILTMENTVKESVERLFNISASTDMLMNYTVEEVINLLKTEGELFINDDNPIDIIIKYVPAHSVDTGYLYTLTEDLEDEGYEVIALVQDYIKRINSTYNNSGDVRLELGSVADEFKTFAAIKDIPVISASQLNRDASKHIDEGRKTNKADLVRMLGRSNIGESMLMLENIDGGFLIAPEYDEHGNKFLGIQRIKSRYRASSREHIYQPYVPGNEIALVEDLNAVAPVFKDCMRGEMETITAKFNSGLSNTGYVNNIKQISEVQLLNADDNIYKNPTATYSSIQYSNNFCIPENTVYRSNGYMAPVRRVS